jgi:polyhydroxyalkanoate synthesis regulator phasin
MKNRVQALLMARELEAYQAEGPSKIAAMLCDLVKQLEIYEQEVDSLRERVKSLEMDIMEQSQ